MSCAIKESSSRKRLNLFRVCVSHSWISRMPKCLRWVDVQTFRCAFKNAFSIKICLTNCYLKLFSRFMFGSFRRHQLKICARDVTMGRRRTKTVSLRVRIVLGSNFSSKNDRKNLRRIATLWHSWRLRRQKQNKRFQATDFYWRLYYDSVLFLFVESQ